jgi:hypothetical protein
MGEVFRATDTRLGREVALKLLPKAFAADSERLARFDREARLLASLNHPGIAQLYGFETATLDDGTTLLLIAMELIDGEELAERLKRGPIPVDEAIALAKQIADALEAAHEKGIVHRDLKPANIKLTPDGQVKVLDFGLTKAYEGDATSGSSSDLSHSPTMTRGTEAGLILGTAAYMSPEQARGRPVDKRADIWSFGVVLYEMLTGQRLFAGETVSDILAAVLRQDVDWKALPATTPPAVRQVLRRCLEREPKQRQRDIGDARLLLEEGLAAPSVVEASPRRAPLWQRVAPWALAALTVLAAGTLALRDRSAAPGETRAFRFPIPLAGIDTLRTAMISPDGRHLTYAGNDRLWLRSLDQAEPVAFEGTTGARDPFWSHDSRSIAFFSAGSTGSTLKKIALGGSPAERLADVPAGSANGSWSSTGAILVEVTESADGDGWYLLRSGATTVTRIRAFANDRPLSPDKGHPQFQVSKDDLWITDRAGRERKRLLATPFTETAAALSPDGRVLAFASDVTGSLEIYLQSFPGGENRVRVSAGGGAAPRWRSDGRALFYVTLAGQVMAVPFAGSGPPAAAIALPRPLFQFDASALRAYDVTPDGQRFLLSLTGSGAYHEVVVGWTRLLGAGATDRGARP